MNWFSIIIISITTAVSSIFGIHNNPPADIYIASSTPITINQNIQTQTTSQKLAVSNHATAVSTSTVISNRTTNTNNKADWYIYTNDEYGFSISYPKSILDGAPREYSLGPNSSFAIADGLNLYIPPSDSQINEFVTNPYLNNYQSFSKKFNDSWDNTGIMSLTSFATTTNLIKYNVAYYNFDAMPCTPMNVALLIYEQNQSNKYILNTDIFSEIANSLKFTTKSKMRPSCNVPALPGYVY